MENFHGNFNVRSEQFKFLKSSLSFKPEFKRKILDSLDLHQTCTIKQDIQMFEIKYDCSRKIKEGIDRYRIILLNLKVKY